MYVILLLMNRDEHNLEPYIETKPRVRRFQWEKKKKNSCNARRALKKINRCGTVFLFCRVHMNDIYIYTAYIYIYSAFAFQCASSRLHASGFLIRC